MPGEPLKTHPSTIYHNYYLIEVMAFRHTIEEEHAIKRKRECSKLNKCDFMEISLYRLWLILL